jgi:hypothetical protein
VSETAAARFEPAVPSGFTRLGAGITLLAAALALGVAGLLTPAVCLLTLLLIVVAALPVPSWTPGLISSSRRRSGVALLAVLLLVIATAGSGPGALASGGLQGTLAAAVAELALPPGVPIGLFVALTAGALVAVALELTDRRGVQSALVLGVAVLGLASVAAPGPGLIAVFGLGWPAVLLTLTRLASTAVSPVDPAVGVVGAVEVAAGVAQAAAADGSIETMRPILGADSPARAHRALLRWQVLPVLVAIALSCGGLALVAATGLMTLAARPAVEGGVDGLGQRSALRSTSDFFGDTLDLTARGALASVPQLAVPIDSPRLWRVATLDFYTGSNWMVADPLSTLPRVVLGPSDTASLVPAVGSETALEPGGGLSRPPEESRTDQVRPLLAEPQVFAPGRLTSVTSASLIGGRVSARLGNRLLVVSRDHRGLGSYTVQTQVLPRVDEPAQAERLGAVGVRTPSGTTSQAAFDQRWTQLPQTVPERVRHLGVGLVQPAPSRLAAVLAIERELDRRMTYDLNSPAPAAGVDAVDDVLFISHSGFCEQFASAEVVLLRAAGVPARVAVGLAGGEPGADGFRTLRRSDAHAWVEVWFPGVGWVTSDPTPAASPARSWTQTWLTAARSLLGAPATWISGLLLLVLFVLALVRNKRRSSRSGGWDPTRPPRLDADLAAAFIGLEAELDAQGRGRAPSETVSGLGRRLSGTSELAAGSALLQALLVLERALYAPRPPSRAECLAAATVLRRSIDRPS